MKHYPLLLSLPLIAASVTPGFAAETSEQPKTMQQVVVTASRIEESKKEVTSNVSVITQEDIAQSPSQNLADLLAENGLGHIQKYPGSLTSIGIRGFRTDTHGNDLQGHVLILLDGRRAGSGNAAKILTKNVERVEIIRGPGAVQYGSAGMGGVINVITRKGNDNSLFVEAGAGSFDRFEGSVGGTAKGSGFDFSGSLTVRSNDDYETGSGDTFYNTGINQEVGISLQGGYTFSKNHRIGMIFTGFDVDEAGSPGYLSQNDRDNFNDKSNYSFDTKYTGQSGSGNYLWMARYFFGQDKNSWIDPVDSNPSGWDNGIDSENKTDQMGAQAQVTGLFGQYTLTAGFDWIDYKVKNTWSPNETTYENPAFFLLGKAKFLEEKLITTFGVRFDWFEVAVVDPVGRNESTDNLTPQIGLAYHATDNLKLRIQYAEGFMMPSAKQLAIDTVSWGRRVVGNPDLDSEKSTTYEGGIDYYKKSFKGSLTYFHTDFEDKIVTVDLGGGTQSWDNVGDATIAGVEAAISYDFGELMEVAWEIRPYLQATFLTELKDKENGEDLQYVNDTTVSTGLVANNGQGLFCRFNVAYYSSQDVKDYESGGSPTPIVELDSVTLASLTASYRFYESDQFGAFTIRGELENLFDEDYAHVKGYPMPGRSFFISLRWDY